jgi:putative heme iron utilization protein
VTVATDPDGSPLLLTSRLSGHTANMEREPADLRTDLGGAEALVEAEPGALAHLNEDHREALELYATGLAGASPGAWRASGLDPEGLDLMLGDQTARVVFPQRVNHPKELRQVLRNLADQVRRDLAS